MPEKYVILTEVKTSGQKLNIELIGFDGALSYTDNGEACITISLPGNAKLCDYASAFKITGLK